jgi:membrane-associated phospholipid phosphatase
MFIAYWSVGLDPPTAVMPEEKRQIKESLEEAIQEVQSPEQAERVLDDLEQVAAGVSEAQAARGAEVTPLPPAEAVKQAAENAPPGEKAVTTLAAAAAQAARSGSQAADTHEVAQQVLLPEARGRKPAPEIVKPRGYLQEAVLRRMTPLQAWDAHLFIAVNYLPHTKLSNTLMYALTVVATGGVCWSVGTLWAYLRGSARARRALRELVPSVTIATWLVEYPIKTYFRRKRPFIEVVRALVIGKKPGSWSFPSGHSASSFASARVLGAVWPEHRAAYYALACLVGFSRIYLGAHYPGDVLSGAFAGSVLGELARRATRAILARR